MAEVAKLEGIPLKGGHGDHHFKIVMKWARNMACWEALWEGF